jgi:hypothetical protein
VKYLLPIKPTTYISKKGAKEAKMNATRYIIQDNEYGTHLNEKPPSKKGKNPHSDPLQHHKTR